MLQKGKAGFAIYRNKDEISEALSVLRKLDFKESDFSVMLPKTSGPQDFSQIQRNQLKRGAIIGAILGGIIVGILYFLLGVGVLHSNSVSSFSLAARSVSALIGLLLGSILGAAAGLLVGIGTPDFAGKRLGQYLKSGGLLLVVHCQNHLQSDQVKEVLSATGGQDVYFGSELPTWEEAYLETVRLTDVERKKDLAAELAAELPTKLPKENLLT